MNKKFKIPGDQIRTVASGYGSCIATDKITVEGQRVRFKYREEPDNDIDSGWRFMAGTESDAYMNDPQNHEIYDVNTIANYDQISSRFWELRLARRSSDQTVTSLSESTTSNQTRD